MWTRDTGYRELWWDNGGEAQLVEWLLSFEGTCWAHFGGGYDYKWLLDWAIRLGRKPRIISAGSRIVCLKIGKAIFCDSFALAPMKLEKLTKDLGVKKIKLGLKCNCGIGCGGYCRINRRMSPEDKTTLSEYLRQDVLSLKEALTLLIEFAAENDIDLGITIGSSAWRNVKRKHGLLGANLSGADYKFVKEAYFGGRTQRYRRGMVKLTKEWDVNSMYPFCLKKFPVPTGTHWRSYGNEAASWYEKGQPGFYRAMVDVPESMCPPLPRRYRKSTSVSFPFGQWEGVWTRDELKYAESVGVKVTVSESLVWERESYLFSNWIAKLWDLRFKVGKDSALGVWLKLFMNSMIGKMGSNPMQEKFEILPSREKIRANVCTCPVDEKCEKGHYKRVSEFVYSREVWKLLDCCHIEWAAPPISNARVYLNKAQMMGDGFDMVYSDTDSLFREEELIFNVGDDLGQFQLKGERHDFEANAPKSYSYYHYEKGERKLEAKSKGIELPYRIGDDGKKVFTERPTVGKRYKKEGVAGFRSGARKGKFFEKITISRIINEQFGDRLERPSKMSRHTAETPFYPPKVNTFPPHVFDLPD